MTHVLVEIFIVLAASLVAVYALGRAGLPSIVGFLAAGIAIGPNGFQLVEDQHLIEHMAEIGVVLLLFTIGLKFSIAELTRMKNLVFGAGAMQVGATIAAVTGAALLCDVAAPKAVFLGLLVAMSSTAILLKLLEEKAETDSPHGRLAIGVAIFQDLCVVPAMLVTPMLAGKGGSTGAALLDLGKSLGVIVGVLLGARLLLPHYFAVVAKTKSREVFTLATILVVFATAAATAMAGLSPALGALIAGVVLSESDYANQVMSDVVPLRDLLASLFFVSIGMLVNVREWVAEPVVTFGLAAGVVALKGGVVWAIGRAFGLSTRIALLAGLSLSQVGEFSFVLAMTGKDDLLGKDAYSTFLSVSVLSMIATPFLMLAAPWITGKGVAAHAGHGEHETVRKDHVIVVGHGIVGRNVVSTLGPLKVRTVVLELNPASIRAIRAAGGDAAYGDACSEDVLTNVGIQHAKALVLTALDPVATRQVVAAARRLAPQVEIFVRTRFVSEMAELQRLGASAVVPEEFETSIALSGLVMRRFGATETAVARAAGTLRGRDYELLSDETTDLARAGALAKVLSAATFSEIPVPDTAAGRTLRALDLRAKSGVTVVGVQRGSDLLSNPAADFQLAPGDVLVVLGKAEAVQAAQTVLGAATA